MQTDFIALYRGQTVAEARLVAVTAEPEIVSRFVRELGGFPDPAEQRRADDWRMRLGAIRGTVSNSSSIIYRPYPDTTAETEAAALAVVYAFILGSYEGKKGAGLSALDDAEGDNNDRATRIIQED